MPIANIPVGTIVHNVEIKIGKGGQIARSAGSYVQIVGRDQDYVILRLSTTEQRLVHGRCMVKRHQRQTAQQEGGIISKEGSVHLSNLAIADPKDGKPTRVGFKIDGDKKVRIAKRSGEVING